MKDRLLGTCQHWLNEWIVESTAARTQLRAIDGCTLGVQVEGLGLGLRLKAHRETILVDDGNPGEATATVQGTPFELLTLLGGDRTRAPAGSFRDSGARLNGRIEVAERFSEILRLARPDFEELLARWIGDMPAYELGRTGRAVFGWTLASAHALERDTAEYLKEERRLLPARTEVAALLAGIERTRDDVERLAARIARLQRGGARR